MTEKIDNFVSFIAYTYNNENEIDTFFRGISEIGESFTHTELILVDDQSSDKTRDKIIEKSKEFCGSVTLITMGQHQGVEKAITAGVKQSMGDFIYEFETVKIDYEPNLIIDVFTVGGMGNDVVFVSNSSYNRVSSNLFYRLFNNNLYLENGTTSNTFRLVSRRAVNRVEELGIDVLYRKLSYANCGLKTTNVQYSGNKANYSNRQTSDDRKTQAMNNFIILTNIASKYSSIICIVMMLLTIMISIYTIVVFLKGMTVSGYTSTMLVLSGCMCVIFLLFNICIRYLSLLVRVLFNTNSPIIQSIDILK